MKILYLDCFSGISGDMLLGALIDLGVPVEALTTAYGKLPIPPVRLRAERVLKQGISAINVTFGFDERDSPLRSYRDVREMIGGSGLDSLVREEALQIFDVLAEAESQVHGIDKEKVHFHEVGALDTICDVVGAVIGKRYLGVERVYVSPMPFGRGSIDCAHGTLPNPAPATLTLLKGFEMVQLPYTMEFVTPTGAAIVKTWADPEGPVPSYRLLEVGHGTGDKEIPRRSNLLRAMLGEVKEEASEDRVIYLETDIDDESPEVLGHVFYRLFAHGALDVTAHPVVMKKNRLGTRLNVIAPVERQEDLMAFLLEETSTLGVRLLPVSRRTLPRETLVIKTSLGEATVKVATLKDGKKKISPEYETCTRLAEAHHLPLREVMDLVKREAESQLVFMK